MSSIPVRVKPKTIQLVFAASLLYTQDEEVGAKIGLLRIGVMHPSGASRLPADCCVSELAL